MEVVFVDDSMDNTLEVIRKLQAWFPLPIKLSHRPKELRKNGLSERWWKGSRLSRRSGCA